MARRHVVALSCIALLLSLTACEGGEMERAKPSDAGDEDDEDGGSDATDDVDAGEEPTAPRDASVRTPDSGKADASSPARDAGSRDSGTRDAGPRDASVADAGGALWAPECPDNFVPMPGVNNAFPTPTGMRSFSLNLPADTSTPRPVWVPLTGSVESTNENLDARGGNRKLTSSGAIVIGPVRRCAGTVDGAGTADNGGACNTAGSGGWNWNPWNEGRAFGPAGDPWKTDEGPDSKFFESIIKCVATKWPVDQKRLFIAGISSGGTMTNRALTFRADFWAGGMPISGEWYVTRDDGTSWGSDDFAARRMAVADAPTKIFQGRVGPFPLKTALDPMIVITVWGGAMDLWNCSDVLCADYRPTTQVGSNYFSSFANVVHIACSSTHGHQWPTINRDAFNQWALMTLSSHPKGTAKSAFRLTPPPSGYTCELGVFRDHY